MQMVEMLWEKFFQKVPLGPEKKPILFWFNLLVSDPEKGGSQQHIN